MSNLALSTSPAIVTNSTGTAPALTTGSFTPVPGALLLPLWAGNSIDPLNPSAPTITDNLTLHAAWVLNDWQSHADSPAVNGQAGTWRAFAAGSAMTVTINNNAASPNEHAALAVMALTGVDYGAPIGQHGKAGSASVTSFTVTYTATRDGSWGFLAVADWDAGGLMSPGTNTTTIGTATIGTDLSYGFFRTTNPDGARGASVSMTVTVGAGPSLNTQWAWVEVLPDITPPRPYGSRGPYGFLRGGPPKPRRRFLKSFTETASGVQTQAEAGLTPVVILSTGVARKVAVQTGRTVVAPIGTGVAAKRTPQVGTTALAVAAGGSDRKVAPQAGRAVVIAVSTGSGRKVAPQAGTTELAVTAGGAETIPTGARPQTGAASIALRGLGAAAKRAVGAGTAVLTVNSTGAEVKRAISTGTTEVAVRGAGTAVHQQAETGRTVIAPIGTGSAAKRTGEVGRAGLALVSTGAATNRVATQTGTAEVAITAAGREATGTSRPQTGSAVLPVRALASVRKTAILTGASMVALTGNGSQIKRATPTGAATAVMRAAGLASKQVAAAGKSYAALRGLAIGGKRVNAAGRTVVPLLSYGTQALVVPRIPLGVRLEEILNSLISFTKRLGIFQAVQGHEPKAAPRNGLTAALWLQAMAPAIGQSGLDSTSLRVAWFLRIYQNFLSKPEDSIDPKVMKAMATVMETLSGNFDLDLPQVRAIDLLGITGPPMAAEAGYITMGPPDNKIYRCMTLTIPIIVDDAFAQVA
jgi:hypothetical protein